MQNDLFQRIARRIDTYRDESIRLQTDLTTIQAMGPENNGYGEREKAEYIKKYLNTLKIDNFQEINAPDDRIPDGYRPNLLVKFNGKSDKKTIWIMSHLDVVDPGDLSLWESDPFKVIEKEGKLYGRGTEDNQQGIVSSVLAVKALQEENIVPEYNIGLAIVADEEAGSGYGIQYVLKTNPDLFQLHDYIIIPDAGNEQGTMIEVAEKSIMWIKVKIKGKQTHGSTPQRGINAHKAGAHFIVKMNQLYQLYDYKDTIFDVPISTFEPTKKESNVPNINTIPGEDIFCFDCRVMPKYDITEIQERIRSWGNDIEKEFGVTVSFSYPQNLSAPPPTPSDAPVVSALKKAVKAVMNREASPMGIGGGTVAAYFRQAGLQPVCWSTIDDLAHEPNEYCVIDNLLNDAKVFAYVFLHDE